MEVSGHLQTLASLCPEETAPFVCLQKMHQNVSDLELTMRHSAYLCDVKL